MWLCCPKGRVRRFAGVPRDVWVKGPNGFVSSSCSRFCYVAFPLTSTTSAAEGTSPSVVLDSGLMRLSGHKATIPLPRRARRDRQPPRVTSCAIRCNGILCPLGWGEREGNSPPPNIALFPGGPLACSPQGTNGGANPTLICFQGATFGLTTRRQRWREEDPWVARPQRTGVFSFSCNPCGLTV